MINPSSTSHTQTSGADTGIGASNATSNSKMENVVEEFLKYMNRTPAELMRDQILRELGMTEEDIKNMPPEKRKAVEEKIADMMLKRIQEQMKKEMAKKEGLPIDFTPKLSDAANQLLLQLQEKTA